MTYIETDGTRVSTTQAIRELRSHSCHATVLGGWLIDRHTNEKIVMIGTDGNVSARGTLDFLGY